MRYGKSGVMAASLIVNMVSVSAAQATCWSEPAATAARVRELDTLLMVSALRCRASNPDLIPRYNGFVQSSRGALVKANSDLRGHFSQNGAGLSAYDRYVTALANRYGGGGLACADVPGAINAARLQGGSLQSLDALAREAGVMPELAGGMCTVRVAGR